MSFRAACPCPARLLACFLVPLALPSVACWYSLDPVNNNNDSPPQDATVDASALDSALPDAAIDAATDAAPDAGDTCGNQVLDSNEDCDGTRLGSATCQSRGFTGGELACDACQFDESQCYICGGSSGQNCPASSISDDFEDMTLGALWGSSWNDGLTTYHETASGFLRFTLAINTDDSYAGYLTTDPYDLTEDAVTLEIKGVPNPALIEAELAFEIAYATSSDYAGINVAGGSISAFYWASGTPTTVTQRSYSSSSDRYWRIRESGGRLYFETSPDGQTWNPLGDVANPWPMTAVYIGIQAGTWDPVADPGTATVDNFNLVP